MSNRTKIITAAAQREYELFLLYGKPAGFTYRQWKASPERKQAYEHGTQNEAVRDFIRRGGLDSAAETCAKKQHTRTLAELFQPTRAKAVLNECGHNSRGKPDIERTRFSTGND